MGEETIAYQVERNGKWVGCYILTFLQKNYLNDGASAQKVLWGNRGDINLPILRVDSGNQEKNPSNT